MGTIESLVDSFAIDVVDERNKAEPLPGERNTEVATQIVKLVTNSKQSLTSSNNEKSIRHC